MPFKAGRESAPPADPEVKIIITLVDADCRKIARRAKRLAERRAAVSGLAQPRREDRDRLAALRDGGDLIGLPSEHRADETAAELHAEYPWMAAATEIVWHATRQSVWSRRLAEILTLPSLVIEATSESARLGLVGAQRGWASAAPGRLVQTILPHRIGTPPILVDALETSGSVESRKGRSFDLSAALLPLLAPATARRQTVLSCGDSLCCNAAWPWLSLSRRPRAGARTSDTYVEILTSCSPSVFAPYSWLALSAAERLSLPNGLAACPGW